MGPNSQGQESYNLTIPKDSSILFYFIYLPEREQAGGAADLLPLSKEPGVELNPRAPGL